MSTDFSSKYAFAFEDSDDDTDIKPTNPTTSVAAGTNSQTQENVLKWQSAEKQPIGIGVNYSFGNDVNQSKSPNKEESDFLAMIKTADKSDLKIF